MRHPSKPSLAAHVAEQLRVIIVAGIATGVLVIGVGSRVAMLILRLTSPEQVNGTLSDDGFRIGQVTLGGTYNLLHLGAALGIIGAGAYRLVAPWLIGPTWFRRFTTGAASAAVVGSMLVHADGIDFTVLQPTWLAIGLFVALPGAFGIAVGAAVDHVARRPTATARGHRRWWIVLALVVPFPGTLLVAVPLTVVITAFALAHRSTSVQQIRASAVYGLVLRGAWLTIAVLGLVALVGDVRAIA